LITKKKRKFTETAGANGKDSPIDLLQFILADKDFLSEKDWFYDTSGKFDWMNDQKESAAPDETIETVQSPMTEREDKGSW